LEAGTYYIYSKHPGPNNEKLAMTCTGAGNPVTMTAAAQSLYQRWTITYLDTGSAPDPGFDEVAMIRPAHSKNLLVTQNHQQNMETIQTQVDDHTWGIYELESDPQAGYLIGERVNDGLMPIQVHSWQLRDTDINANVMWAKESDSAGDKARWTFEMVVDNA
jgi:hypothetical protein